MEPDGNYLGAMHVPRIQPFLFAFLLMPCCIVSVAQDKAGTMVPNGGFERVSATPHTYDQLKLAEGWSNITLGLSEVFDPTAAPKTVGLPQNGYGAIMPGEGVRCAGFFAWKDDQRRNWEGGSEDPFRTGWSAYSEYLMVELAEPLEGGRSYTFSMSLALASTSDRAVSGIGAYFSPVALRYEHRRFLEEKAQVAAGTILAERGVWTAVSGTFEADGGERYLVIGVFPYVGFETQRIIEGPDNQYAYYFLDALELVPGDAAQ